MLFTYNKQRTKGGGPVSEVSLNEVRSSLDVTDGCIIDGDQDSVTFAVKIPRSVLRANHHFLLAASEAATDFRPMPPVYEAPVRIVSHWGKRLVRALPAAIGLAASLSFLVAFGLWVYWSVVPAVAFQSILPDQPAIAQGKPLIMIISAEHNRPCHITYRRTVMREKSNDVVYSDSHLARHQEVTNGYEVTTSMIPLPILPAGEYVLYINGDFDCGTLDDHTKHVLTAHFSIIAE